MAKYEIIIYWSQEDEAFIALPELPGCMADGRTYQEAVQNAEVIIREWIETAREPGRSIPAPKSRFIPELPKRQPISKPTGQLVYA